MIQRHNLSCVTSIRRYTHLTILLTVTTIACMIYSSCCPMKHNTSLYISAVIQTLLSPNTVVKYSVKYCRPLYIVMTTPDTETSQTLASVIICVLIWNEVIVYFLVKTTSFCVVSLRDNRRTMLSIP